MDSVETSADVLTLGAAAVGNIDPATRNLDKEKMAELEKDVLEGRFDVNVAEGVILPCGCIDGRCFHNALPNAAGGTLSLLVGEMLTDGSNIASNAENSEEALASLIEQLRILGFESQIGGHTGPTHGNEEASGCGANDQLAGILSQIVDKADGIFATAQKLGATMSRDVFDGMVARAQQYGAREKFFLSGSQVAETLGKASPEGNCPRVEGPHNEVLIRINTVEGTTLDRRALQEAYGDEYQIFNVDAWSLRKAAETLSVSEQEADEKYGAMVIYQIATALQLCGPSMKIVVR